jgi:hypothetical protein
MLGEGLAKLIVIDLHFEFFVEAVSQLPPDTPV